MRATKGAALTDYGVIVGLISTIVVGSVIAVGPYVRDTFFAASDEIEVALDNAGHGDGQTPGQTPGGGQDGGGDEGDESLAPLMAASQFISYADPGQGNRFVDVNQASYQVHSETFLASDLAAPAELTVGGHGTALMSINGEPPVTSGTINPGQSLELYLQPPATYSTEREAFALLDGEVFALFRITTRSEPDLTPDAFTLGSVTDAQPGAYVSAPVFSLAGVEVNEAPVETGVGDYTVTATVSGEGSPELRRNGEVWTTATDVVNEESIEFRITASPTAGETRTATLTIGGVSADFSVTTAGGPAPVFEFASAGDLGTFDLSDGNPITSIPVTMENVTGFALVENPAELAGTNVRLAANEGASRVDIFCDNTPDCVGTHTFTVDLLSYDPNVAAQETFTITFVE